LVVYTIEALFENPLPLFPAASELSFSPRNHQPGPQDYENNADGGRDLLVMFGGNANMRITEVDPVMFRVRDGNEKRKNPQHHQQDSRE
jgi:hypothetical protein